MQKSSHHNHIITTIGPSSASTEIVTSLKGAGATIFRINLSHSDENSLDEYYKFIVSANVLPSIDTQGAQLRAIQVVEPRPSDYGETTILGSSSTAPHHFDIQLNHPEYINQIAIGDSIKIGFDGLVLQVVEISTKTDQTFTATVKNLGLPNIHSTNGLKDSKLLSGGVYC